MTSHGEYKTTSPVAGAEYKSVSMMSSFAGDKSRVMKEHNGPYMTTSYNTEPTITSQETLGHVVGDRLVSGFSGFSGISGRSATSFVTSPSARLETVTFPEGTREIDQRTISTRIVHEEDMPAKDTVRYVEVPVYQDIVKEVTKKETRHVEKRVPKYEIEVVDKVVEVPQLQWVDKEVEVPHTEVVLKHVPRVEVVDRQIDIVKHVPIIELQEVEKIVSVPSGEIIEVPKTVQVEQRRTVDVNHDTRTPVLIAQTVNTNITKSGHTEVACRELSPEIVSVDIHVAKPVDSHLVAKGVVGTVHQHVDIPSSQYNWLLRHLNQNLDHQRVEKLPYKEENGRVEFSHTEVPHHVVDRNVEVGGVAPSSAHTIEVVDRAASFTSESSSRSFSDSGSSLIEAAGATKCCASRQKTDGGCCGTRQPEHGAGRCARGEKTDRGCCGPKQPEHGAGRCARGEKTDRGCCGPKQPEHGADEKTDRGCCGPKERRHGPALTTSTKKSRTRCGKQQEITTHRTQGCCSPKVKVVKTHKVTKRDTCFTTRDKDEYDVKVTKRQSPCYRGPAVSSEFYDLRSILHTVSAVPYESRTSEVIEM
ncbi:MAG: uncharacterized protein KVP18_003464 [Porospora cf. gigantea A]|uniref:uncharacterized protein n=1 Tax=Porospora cf. gigantea A TaxID=2853593 RepID=UPI0035594F84|nr:MAG: hypothetical protein KVP18_003464 [Porospora cf. gigantea A]